MKTATNINALRGELVGLLYGIEDIDQLLRIGRSMKRAVKPKPQAAPEEEYIEKEELLAALRESLMEVREARRTGKKLQTLSEVLHEL